MSYNDYLTEFTKMEMDKIPRLFLFSKTRAKVVFTLMGILLIAIGCMITATYNSRELASFDGISQTYEPIRIAEYSTPMIIITICLGVILFFLALWVCIALAKEKKAFRRASLMAANKAKYDRDRDHAIWEQQRLHGNML